MMKKKNNRTGTVLKLVSIVVCFAILVGGGAYFLLPYLNREKPVNTALSDAAFGWKFPIAKFPITGTDGRQIAYSTIRDPGGVAQGLPVRLKIPSIGVDSAIEDARITNDGRMDVPAGSVNVAWFALGPHPGKEGSAVIGGHFGIENGKQKVFYRLSELGAGAKVYIVDDNGQTLAFVVRSIKLFNRDADATSVFTSSDGKAHLNLITCEGVWNQVNDTYPDRRVVFTDSIPSEGAVAVAAKPAAVKPTLPEAAKTVAKSTPKTSPASSATPTQEPSETPAPAPSDTLTTGPNSETNPASSPQILIASAKSLYATPVDGVISSLLIIAILFITFKIVRP